MPIDCQHFRASRHLGLFSKHKEINFDNFISVSLQLFSLSQLVNSVRLNRFHWWDHFPSHLKSSLEDYYTILYRLHRKLGSDVPFQFLRMAGRPCIFGLLAEYFRIYRVQSLVYGYLVGAVLNVFFGLS